MDGQTNRQAGGYIEIRKERKRKGKMVYIFEKWEALFTQSFNNS